MDNLMVPEGITDIKPIREIIYEHLRQLVLDGVLKPGERLIERDIAIKFKASRTPVREALRKLEMEGLVEYIARKGIAVRGFNVEEIEEIYKIRKVLECLAIKNVIINVTDNQMSDLKKIIEGLESEENADVVKATGALHDFDYLIMNAANMPLLKTFLHSLRESLERYRRINLNDAPRRKEAIREHKSILQAIIDRNEQLAEALVCQHVDNSRKELMRLISQQ